MKEVTRGGSDWKRESLKDLRLCSLSERKNKGPGSSSGIGNRRWKILNVENSIFSRLNLIPHYAVL